MIHVAELRAALIPGVVTVELKRTRCMGLAVYCICVLYPRAYSLGSGRRALDPPRAHKRSGAVALYATNVTYNDCCALWRGGVCVYY